MKEKIKIIAKDLLEFTKKNTISCVCFLLATLIALTGSASFAKYVSGDFVNKNPGAATMHGSSEVDGVSALSFTNTAFWGGGTDGDGDIAMNSLRYIDVAVNNFETVGGANQLSEVPMEYELSFRTPMEFSSNLAFQLIDKTKIDDENEKNEPLLPQIVMSQIVPSELILQSGQSETLDITFDGKAHYNGEDYVGSDDKNYLTFTVTRSRNASGIFSAICTATRTLADGSIEEITITMQQHIEQNVPQQLMFRVWDTSMLGEEHIEIEGGTLLPPLRAVINTDVEMMNITISMSRFTFSVDSEQTHNYRFTISPTEALADDHLGAVIILPEGENSISSGMTVDFCTTTEKYFMSRVPVDSATESDWVYIDTVHLIASPKTYNENEVIDISDLKPTYKTETTKNQTATVPSDILTELNSTLSSSSVDIYELPTENKNYIANGYYYFAYNNGNFNPANNTSATNQKFRIKLANNNTSIGTKITKETYNDTATGSIITTLQTTVTSRIVVKVDTANNKYYFEEITSTEEISKQFTGTVSDTTITKTTTYDLPTTSNSYTIEMCYGYSPWFLDWYDVDVSGNNNNINNSSPTITQGTFSNLITALGNLMPTTSTTEDGSRPADVTFDLTPSDEVTTNTNYYRIEREVVTEKSAELSYVGQMQYPEDGDPYLLEYTGSNPLTFTATVDGKTIQAIFLSSCYSKEYPTAVKVIFRQIQ